MNRNHSLLVTQGSKMRLPLVIGLAAIASFAGCKQEEVPPPEVPVAAKVISFAAVPLEVEAGQQATLVWNVQDASRVAITTLDGQSVNLGNSASAQQGSVTVTVTQSTIYLLTAFGEGGSDGAAASVVVAEEDPTLLFVVTAPEIVAGQETTLVWNVPAAAEVVISEGATVLYQGPQNAGSLTVKPQFDQTYSLSANGRTAEVQVRVAPAIHAFQVTPLAAAPGDTVTLSWSVGGATAVTLEAVGRGDLFTATEPAQIADGSYQDVVPTNLPERDAIVVYRLKVAVQGGALQREVTLHVGVDPLITSFVVPGFGLAGGSFPVSWTTAEADEVEIALDGAVVFRAATAADVAKGTASLATPAAQATVEIRARNHRGGVATESATIEPVGLPALVDFSADKATLALGGEQVTLSWNVTNARHIRVITTDGKIIVDRTGVAAETGTFHVYPNKTTTYVLSADNSIGDALDPPPSLAVAVTESATLAFNPGSAPANAPIAVTGHNVPNGTDILDLPWAVLNAPGEAFVDIKADGTAFNYPTNFTSTSYSRPLPETFNTTVHGAAVTATYVNVNINGWMRFQTSSSATSGGSDNTGTSIGTALHPLAIAPYFDDLRSLSAGGSEIYYRMDGTGANQRVIVQWDNVEHADHSGSSLTFQAQIYASGKIVFAYQTVTGVPTTTVPAVGVVNGDETSEVNPLVTPQPGDTITFFGVAQLPATITNKTVPFVVRVVVGPNPEDIVEVDVTCPVIGANDIHLTEVNVSPTVANGQWLEIENTSAVAHNLLGWKIEFPNDSHEITSALEVPAGGRVLLAQSTGAADGLTVDYVYGTTYAAAAGAPVSLQVSGAPYDAFATPSASVSPGFTWQIGSLASGVTAVTGVTSLQCTAARASTYGTNGQRGTPGAANTACPNYVAPTAITGNFESIGATGVRVTFASTGEDVAAVTLQAPAVIGNVEFSTLYVGTNGFLGLFPITCPSATNCYNANKASLSTSTAPAGVIAPFWDDLDYDVSSLAAGVFVERKVPGVTPNDGYTIISWEKVTHAAEADDLNFQVKFFDTGDVEFHYGTLIGENGSSQTVWFEHPSGAAGYLISVNSSTPGILSNSAYRFAAQ